MGKIQNKVVVMTLAAIVMLAVKPTSVFSFDDQLEIRMSLAEAYMMDGDYDNSIAQYKIILKDDPVNIKVLSAIAEMLTWQQKNEEALKYFESALLQRQDKELLRSYGKALLYAGHYDDAQKIFQQLLDEDPSDIDAKIYLGDVLLYRKDYDKAIQLYRGILAQRNDAETRRKLADVLSWTRHYDEALGLYDELLQQKNDPAIRLQKARILGWSKRHDEAIKEYQKILDLKPDESVRLEKDAKQAYWNNRVKKAISSYQALVERDPDNAEAMFDLSQIYSYQSMWDKARAAYDDILKKYPDHLRAHAGKGKIDQLQKSMRLRSGYRFFEGDSQDRVSDIRKHVFFNELLSADLNGWKAGLTYERTTRSFSDYDHMAENEGRLGGSYVKSSDWWADAFVGMTDYSKDIETMHAFGMSGSARLFDMSVATLSMKRRRLENSSSVIVDRMYADDYNLRIDADLSRHWKIGADGLYSNYSDDNDAKKFGADILYYFSFEPKKLTVRYRYEFRDFRRDSGRYFCPQNFSNQILSIDWRHFLNEEEIFFGAKDLYYDLGYDLGFDTEDVFVQRFRVGVTKDFDGNWSANLEASTTVTSGNVYNDEALMGSVTVYF